MVPERLKEARKAAGLSQEKLSELLGIEGLSSRSRLSSYEIGRTEPPFSLVKKIAKILDYPPNYFYTEDDNFAQTVLLFHRNQANAEFNPYHTALIDVKNKINQLNEYVKKL